MYPPLELEQPSAVASLELGRDFGSEGISSLDIVENSPLDDMVFTRSRIVSLRDHSFRKHSIVKFRSRRRGESENDSEIDSRGIVLFRVDTPKSSWRHLILVVAERARRLLSRTFLLLSRHPFITA
jgi:hypothetical protein